METRTKAERRRCRKSRAAAAEPDRGGDGKEGGKEEYRRKSIQDQPFMPRRPGRRKKKKTVREGEEAEERETGDGKAGGGRINTTQRTCAGGDQQVRSESIGRRGGDSFPFSPLSSSCSPREHGRKGVRRSRRRTATVGKRGISGAAGARAGEAQPVGDRRGYDRREFRKGDKACRHS
ncbi:hypothetical protein HPB48_005844 [Haemaphysalis longicornis]|uniref:Uncharacterized protein n=1 Tax=Haemaphysalis longicornis TaxID=44386 RepID=A0A9J6GPL9_HAELO|nr:hypothetical protein HPB48_005844 [Haemaphysalis longicornis]